MKNGKRKHVGMLRGGLPRPSKRHGHQRTKALARSGEPVTDVSASYMRFYGVRVPPDFTTGTAEHKKMRAKPKAPRWLREQLRGKRTLKLTPRTVHNGTWRKRKSRLVPGATVYARGDVELIHEAVGLGRKKHMVWNVWRCPRGESARMLGQHDTLAAAKASVDMRSNGRRRARSNPGILEEPYKVTLNGEVIGGFQSKAAAQKYARDTSRSYVGWVDVLSGSSGQYRVWTSWTSGTAHERGGLWVGKATAARANGRRRAPRRRSR